MKPPTIDLPRLLQDYERDGVVMIRADSRLGFLFVFRGGHTQTDPALKSAYAAAVTATPPA